MAREETINTIRNQPETTVLIIGAGINGIGVFHELAQQGVDVLLVDKGDYSSGTSAASSHMVHGGLRYLENGEFRLVREALYERNLLLQNAPHYVHPLPTTVPIFRWLSGIFNAPLKFLGLHSRPSERGALVIKIGLMLYDLFTGKNQTMPGHSFSARKTSLERLPKLNPDIIFTATYHDAWMSMPERIALELVLDAEDMSPSAHALNYCALVRGSGGAVTLRDELTGDVFDVKPKIVVNAAGPWIDIVNHNMNRQTQYIGGTKGSHIVLDHPELLEATGDGEIFFENKDGRIVLILAYLDRVMVGTTDIHIDDPDKAHCTEEEVDYMLDLVSKVFPDIKVERSHIVFRFSGARPLPHSNISLAGQISRDHNIQIIEAGNGLDFPVLSLVGGKWTTFRAFSEQTANEVLKRLGKTRSGDTCNTAIGGGIDYPHTDSAKREWLSAVVTDTGVGMERVETLFERYGTRAQPIADFLAAGDDEPLQHEPNYSQREIMFILQNEQTVYLDDLLLRRTSLGMRGRVTGDLLEECAAILATVFDWSESETQTEIRRAAEILNDRHGVETGIHV